jgi:hypothetical protein
MPKHRKKRAFEVRCRSCGNTFVTGSGIKHHCSRHCRVREVAKQFNPGDECWEWPGSKNPQTGYGQLSEWSNGKRYLYTAHRVSHEAFIGPISDDKEIMHSCDNRACFNPRHLSDGTHTENMRDMVKKGRCSTRDTRGMKSGRARLTDEQVIFIRSSGARGVDLAEMFGISPTHICAIRKRRTWKHLP